MIHNNVTCRINLPLDETQVETFIIVGFDKLVEIDTQTFTSNTKMISENKVICHADIMVLILRILKGLYISYRMIHATCHAFYPINEILKDLDFSLCLSMESFLVTDQLDRHCITRLMVKAFHHLAK